MHSRSVGSPVTPFYGVLVEERSPLVAKKLLLVEDNLSIQQVVRTLFRADDLDVVVTGDATAGLHKIESWLPDIVLADAAMPDLDGFQLCQIIRNSANLRHIPVRLLTSRGAAYDAAKRVRVDEKLAGNLDPADCRSSP